MRSWLRTRRAALASDEHAFTLIELLVAMALLGFVITATLALLSTGAQTASRDTGRTLAIREAQTGLTRMARDLRQATAFDSVAANKVRMRMQTATSAAATAFVSSYVEYDCGSTSGDDCVRYQWLVSSGSTRPATGQTVVRDLLNSGTAVAARKIFTVNTTSGGGTVRLEIPSAGEQACAAAASSCRQFRGTVVLDDGFFARNLQTA